MAREVFRGTFDLERLKHILDKPVVVDEVPYWLDSESEARSSSTTHTSGDTDGWSSGSSISEGIAEGWDP